MIRVLLFLALVLAFAFGFAWLADRPGTVAVDWMGYQVELSAMVTMIGLIALIVAVMAVWWILKVIIRSPQIMGGYFSSRRRDRGYDALSDGLIAAGSGDSSAAQRHAQQARKLVPDAPLTTVLSATSADLNGDANAKREAYRKMLDDPKTQLLGLRGLYLDAVQDDDEEAARHYATQAATLAPALPWAGQAQFEDHVQRADWPAARTALERNLGSRIVTKTERNRLRAVLLTAEALDREEGEPNEARALAQEAHKLAPDLVPASAVAARLLIRAGKMTQASKAIETTWRKAPHPELSEVYLYVRPGDAVADRVKRARKLAQLCAHQAEGEMALARALMESGDLDAASTTLEPLTGADATQRVCLLLAEIEEKKGGDTAAVRGWMARALRAKRDPVWVADGYISSTWEPVSPLSGRVDAFEWKVPVERYTGHDPVAIPDDAMADDGHVMLPARLPGLAAASGVTAVANVEDASLEIEAEDRTTPSPDNDDGPPEEASDNAKEVEAEPVEPVVEDAEEPAEQETLEAEPEAEEAASVDVVEASPESPAEPAEVMEVDGEKPEETEEPASAEAHDSSGAEEIVRPATPEPESNEPSSREKFSGLPRGQAPDDPGPDADVEEAADGSQRRRFKLF